MGLFNMVPDSAQIFSGLQDTLDSQVQAKMPTAGDSGKSVISMVNFVFARLGLAQLPLSPVAPPDVPPPPGLPELPPMPRAGNTIKLFREKEEPPPPPDPDPLTGHTLFDLHLYDNLWGAEFEWDMFFVDRLLKETDPEHVYAAVPDQGLQYTGRGLDLTIRTERNSPLTIYFKLSMEDAGTFITVMEFQIKANDDSGEWEWSKTGFAEKWTNPELNGFIEVKGVPMIVNTPIMPGSFIYQLFYRLKINLHPDAPEWAPLPDPLYPTVLDLTEGTRLGYAEFFLNRPMLDALLAEIHPDDLYPQQLVWHEWQWLDASGGNEIFEARCYELPFQHIGIIVAVGINRTLQTYGYSLQLIYDLNTSTITNLNITDTTQIEHDAIEINSISANTVTPHGLIYKILRCVHVKLDPNALPGTPIPPPPPTGLRPDPIPVDWPPEEGVTAWDVPLYTDLNGVRITWDVAKLNSVIAGWSTAISGEERFSLAGGTADTILAAPSETHLTNTVFFRWVWGPLRIFSLRINDDNHSHSDKFTLGFDSNLDNLSIEILPSNTLLTASEPIYYVANMWDTMHSGINREMAECAAFHRASDTGLTAASLFTKKDNFKGAKISINTAGIIEVAERLRTSNIFDIPQISISERVTMHFARPGGDYNDLTLVIALTQSITAGIKYTFLDVITGGNHDNASFPQNSLIEIRFTRDTPVTASNITRITPERVLPANDDYYFVRKQPSELVFNSLIIKGALAMTSSFVNIELSPPGG